MLHLLAGLIRHAMAALFAFFPQTKFPDDSTQCGITDGDAVLFAEHFMGALNPSVALLINASDQVGVELDLIASRAPRQLTALADDGTDRIGADLHVPRDFPDAHPLFVHKINRFTLFGSDHRDAVSPG